MTATESSLEEHKKLPVKTSKKRSKKKTSKKKVATKATKKIAKKAAKKVTKKLTKKTTKKLGKKAVAKKASAKNLAKKATSQVTVKKKATRKKAASAKTKAKAKTSTKVTAIKKRPTRKKPTRKTKTDSPASLLATAALNTPNNGLRNGIIFTVVGVFAFFAAVHLINQIQPEPTPTKQLFSTQNAQASIAKKNPKDTQSKQSNLVQATSEAQGKNIGIALPSMDQLDLNQKFDFLNKQISLGNIQLALKLRDQIVKQHPEIKAQLTFMDDLAKPAE